MPSSAAWGKTSKAAEFAVGISMLCWGFFHPLVGSHAIQEGARMLGIPDELQGSWARLLLPHQVTHKPCPARTFLARRAACREHRRGDRANFPSQIPQESKRGRDDKPVKCRHQLSQRSLSTAAALPSRAGSRSALPRQVQHFGIHSSTPENHQPRSSPGF